MLKNVHNQKCRKQKFARIKQILVFQLPVVAIRHRMNIRSLNQTLGQLPAKMHEKTQSHNATLLSTAKSQHQVQGALLLNIVVRKCSAVFQLLAGEDQSLLVGWDAFLVLDLRLHVINRV